VAIDDFMDNLVTIRVHTDMMGWDGFRKNQRAL
jgi:hypothetical protein